MDAAHGLFAVLDLVLGPGDAGDAKVHHPQLAVVQQHDVLGLDVPVDDAVAVGVVEGAEDLGDEMDGLPAGDLAAPHEGADRRGAHARQLLLPGGFLEDEAVGARERPLQKLFLVAGQALGVLLVEAVLDDVAGAHGSLTASPRTAHAVAHEAPGRVAVQLACPVVILILGADAADVCFSCKFHRILLLKLCRSSRRGGAGRTQR